ncbi:MAG: hypothetical protein EAZ92_10920 [Candidatus Kapaibacterium sp.]|nr:MAG: hypothetical protein EAZ92_10920 [Candidatus Kapabacteria bacterium]
MSKELASKADVAVVKADLASVRNELLGEIKSVRNELLGEIRLVEARLERKLTMYMILIMGAIFFTNPDAVSFWLKLFGVMK